MTSLSSRVLCSKWLSPPKRFFGVFPKQFFTLVSQSPAVFWANDCCFRKGSVDGFANYSLHLSPKWLLRQKSSLEGCTNCALHLSASLLLRSKLRELLTCLTHTNPVRRKRPIMSLLLGYFLVCFFLNRMGKIWTGAADIKRPELMKTTSPTSSAPEYFKQEIECGKSYTQAPSSNLHSTKLPLHSDLLLCSDLPFSVQQLSPSPSTNLYESVYTV